MNARTLAINGQTWSFSVGHGSVRITDPREDVHIVSLSRLSRRDPDVSDRTRWKKSEDATITPTMIREYVIANLEE